MVALLPIIFTLTIGRQKATQGIGIASAIISIACCIIGSVLLFRRKTPFTTLLGIIFLILNGLLALFSLLVLPFVGKLDH